MIVLMLNFDHGKLGTFMKSHRILKVSKSTNPGEGDNQILQKLTAYSEHFYKNLLRTCKLNTPWWFHFPSLPRFQTSLHSKRFRGVGEQRKTKERNRNSIFPCPWTPRKRLLRRLLSNPNATPRFSSYQQFLQPEGSMELILFPSF